VHIEHGDDNQHKETERGMEDITASRLAAASSAVRAKPARVLTLGICSSRTASDDSAPMTRRQGPPRRRRDPSKPFLADKWNG